MNYQEIIAELNRLADKDKVQFKQKKFGVVANNSLGVYHKDLKELAKKCGRKSSENDVLAIQLFDSGIYEGRLLCSKLYNPKNVTEELAEKWVSTFENWEICDSFCMSFLGATSFAYQKVFEWTRRKEEFQKRAGFTLMVGYCFANKNADNALIEAFISVIEEAIEDDRVYVKKAVNWALRSIGKRNKDLHQIAIESANRILQNPSKSAQWIAKDALKELNKEKLNILDYPRSIYRPK